MNNYAGKFTAKLEHNITLDDYIEANKVYIRTSKFNYYGHWVLGILALIFGVIGVLINPNRIEGYGAILCGIYFVSAPTFLYRRRMEKKWKSEPSISEPLVVTITEDEIIVKSPYEEGITKWKAFTHYIETKNLFLIFRQQNVFNVVPKRAFENQDMENKFRNLLQKEFITARQIQSKKTYK